MSVSLTGDQLMLKGEGNTQFADFDYGRVVTVFRRPK